MINYLRQLCEQKKVEKHDANACKDHIRMLVSIPFDLSASSLMGQLRRKIFDDI